MPGAGRLLPGEVFPISRKSGSNLAAWLRGLGSPELERVLAARPDAVSAPEPRSVGELADRLQRPASVALALPRLVLPYLQVAEALAVIAPAPRDVLARLLGATDGERAREVDVVLEALADRALVWPDGSGLLHMAAPLRQAWSRPLGLDAPLAQLLADTTFDGLGRMVSALGITSVGHTKQKRLAALLDHHGDPERVAAPWPRLPPPPGNSLSGRRVGLRRGLASSCSGPLGRTPDRANDGRWTAGCWSGTGTGTVRPACPRRWRSRCAAPTGTLRSRPARPCCDRCP